MYYLDQQMKFCKITSWKDIVETIEKKMDDIYLMMKRMMTVMSLKQDKGKIYGPSSAGYKLQGIQ